jgi:hypothetical protein
MHSLFILEREAWQVEPLACTMCYCALFNFLSYFYGLSFPLLVFSFFCLCVIVVILFICVFIWMGKETIFILFM